MPYLCIAFETEVYGRLAQLVQSIWFTPRGSGVRIPQRPRKRFKKDLFLHLSTFSRAPNICKYPIYNFGSYIRFCCELLTPACKKVYLPFIDSVPKSVYSPSFFIFANLLIFNKIILILKNYKLGTCKYLHFAPPFP